MAYRERLLDRQSSTGRPVRVGLVGAGQMGRGFVAQVRRIAGMEVVAVADLDVQRATGALKAAGVENVATGDDYDRLRGVVDEGGTVAVNDPTLLTALPVDMVIDATGVPEIGAQIALNSILAGKHVGLLNVETDITVGWLLSPARRPGRCGLHALPGRRARRGPQARRVRARPGVRRRLRRQGQEQPPASRTTPPRWLTEEANSKRMNPKMLSELRLRLQGDDRDGGPGERRRPGRGQARASAGTRRPSQQLHDVFKPVGRRRHPRPQRRGRLRPPGRSPRGSSSSSTATTPPSSRRWTT